MIDMQYEGKVMQYAAEIKILRIEMKSSKNLQRYKHGLKTSTKFYLEEITLLELLPSFI